MRKKLFKNDLYTNDYREKKNSYSSQNSLSLPMSLPLNREIIEAHPGNSFS